MLQYYCYINIGEKQINLLNIRNIFRKNDQTEKVEKLMPTLFLPNKIDMENFHKKLFGFRVFPNTTMACYYLPINNKSYLYCKKDEAFETALKIAIENNDVEYFNENNKAFDEITRKMQKEINKLIKAHPIYVYHSIQHTALICDLDENNKPFVRCLYILKCHNLHTTAMFEPYEPNYTNFKNKCIIYDKEMQGIEHKCLKEKDE